MNAITTTWRQLVRRRLWPVALLLLAALAAVPVLLSREPAAPEPLEPVAISTEADETIAEPVVAKVTAEDRDRRRRVLGVRKDPFSPAPPKKAKTAQADESEATADDKVPAAPAPSGGGTTTPTGGEAAPEKTYYSPGTIVVRFGDATSDTLQKFAVKKFEALPDEELPLLIYMGLTKNGKKAKFLVDAAVEVDGDGTCKPHPSSCETIELAVGETEFLDVLDPEADQDEESAEDEEASEEAETALLAQFQLDLVDIKRAGDDDVK
jgi:hypothetical protein